MQTFYDRLFAVEGEKEVPEDWKFQLTQVELEQLSVVEDATQGWFEW